MSSEKKSTGKQAKPWVPPKAKPKPKVSPGKVLDLAYGGDSRLPDAFVVLVGGPGGVRSITFHRPIGKTDLAADDWVATPTGEVPDLLARADDPDAGKIEENRTKARFASAVAAGLLASGNGGDYTYPEGKVSRSAILAEARAAAKEASKKEKGKPSPDSILGHLPKEVVPQEVALRAHLGSEATVRAAREKFPDSKYRTLGGPQADRVQTRVIYLTGKNRVQAEDAVYRRICCPDSFSSDEEEEEDDE